MNKSEELTIAPQLEDALQELPILQYGVLPVSEVTFEQRIRYVCEHECPQYNTSWSCPPAVGTVEECRERCSAYTHCFIFSTISEVRDITDMEETLATRMDHEEITHEVAKLLREQYGDVITLSTESCAVCSKCSWPDAPCRNPGRMFPCVESYGIVVSELAQKAGMEFMNGQNIVTWFSVIFFRNI